MENKEGPHLETIPAHSYQSCSGCKFYDYHLVMSGRNPIYASNCKHPDYPHKYGGIMRGNLPNGYKTPKDCPILALKRGGGN